MRRTKEALRGRLLCDMQKRVPLATREQLLRLPVLRGTATACARSALNRLAKKNGFIDRLNANVTPETQVERLATVRAGACLSEIAYLISEKTADYANRVAFPTTLCRLGPFLSGLSGLDHCKITDIRSVQTHVRRTEIYLRFAASPEKANLWESIQLPEKLDSHFLAARAWFATTRKPKLMLFPKAMRFHGAQRLLSRALKWNPSFEVWM